MRTNADTSFPLLMKTPEDICPELPQWPERWMVLEEDVPYGQGIIDALRPFILHLIAKGLTVKTIRRHMSNLWLLGGEIIRDVSMDDLHTKISPAEMLRRIVGPDGGPYCRHLDSEAELRSFDSTCKKLHRFLEETNNNQKNQREC